MKLRKKRDDSQEHLTAALADAKAVTWVLKALSHETSISRVIGVALDEVCSAFGWTYGSYLEKDPKADVLRFSQDAGDVGQAFRDATRRGSFEKGKGLSGQAWNTKDLVFVADIREFSGTRSAAAREVGVTSGVCLPMIVHGDVIGTMDFFSIDSMDLSPSRAEALRSVALLVSSALERIMESQSHGEAARDAVALTQVLDAVSEARTAEEAVKMALDTVREVFDWAYGSYWAVDESGSELRFVRESGNVGQEFRNVTLSASFPRGVGLSGRTWSAGDLVFVEDIGNVTDCVRAPAAQREGVKSGVCFPVRVDGAIVGTMDFFATRTLDLSANRLQALRNVGRSVSQTLERITEAQRARTVLANLASSIAEVDRTISAAGQATATAVGQVEETGRAVRRLGESGAQIGSIIGVIRNIAQQTNLLSLNATIEAARAGQQGRGFAVVAGEVKGLATETADATETVNGQISAIQADTVAAISALDAVANVVSEISRSQESMSMALADQRRMADAVLDESAHGS